MGHGTFSFVMHPVAQQYFLQPAMRMMLPENASVVYCDRRILQEDTPLALATTRFLEKYCCNVFSTGCLVGDVHLLLQSGGVLIAKSAHLLCEAAAIALVVEQAGGSATDEFGDRILDMEIREDHDLAVTLVLGSQMDVHNLGLTRAPSPTNSIPAMTNGVGIASNKQLEM